MGKRKRIGLCYTYNENWIGGTYYIENLIHALGTLDDHEKPHIVLITDSRENYTIAEQKLAYPFMSFRLASGESNRLFQFANKVTGRLIGGSIIRRQIKDLDAVFPYYRCIQQSLAKRKIYWVADFQDCFITNFFSAAEIESRKKNHMEIQASGENLVLSSQDTLQHFKQFYPQYNVSVSVLPFAVTHPDYAGLDVPGLLNKYDLARPYFICPNQFWKHKNQMAVLQAVNTLKGKGIDVTVAFTGKTEDYRNPGYYQELQDYIKEHKIGPGVKFLGFIDRAEQLQLMKHSLAIIQPSLFEGWSTVVEDAKAMNKALIVSDINVHREQLVNSNALFFDPSDADSLALVLEYALQGEQLPALFQEWDYDRNIREFGRNFLSIACK